MLVAVVDVVFVGDNCGRLLADTSGRYTYLRRVCSVAIYEFDASNRPAIVSWLGVATDYVL